MRQLNQNKDRPKKYFYISDTSFHYIPLYFTMLRIILWKCTVFHGHALWRTLCNTLHETNNTLQVLGLLPISEGWKVFRTGLSVEIGECYSIADDGEEQRESYTGLLIHLQLNSIPGREDRNWKVGRIHPAAILQSLQEVILWLALKSRAEYYTVPRVLFI